MRGLPAAHSRDWFSRLAALMEVQLHRSQLLPHLPGLLADAAAALRNYVSPPTPPLAAAAATAAAAEPTAPKPRQKAPAVGAFTDLLVQAMTLLEAQRLLFGALTTDALPFLKASASSTPAALELALSTFSSSSSMLQQTGQPGDSAGQAMLFALHGTWLFINNYTDQVIQVQTGLLRDPKSHPELLSVAKAPQYEQCILLIMALTAYGVLAKQHGVAAGQASNSGSSAAAAAAPDGSSRKARKQKRLPSKVQEDWELGLKLQQHVMPQQQHLLDALGVSRTTFIFAAAGLRVTIEASDMETYIPCYSEAHMASWAAAADAAAPLIGEPLPRRSSRSSSSRSRHRHRKSSSSSRGAGVLAGAQKHLSLASVLLRTAAALPTDSPEYLEACVHAAGGAQLALDQWQQLTRGSDETLVTAAPPGAVQAVHELLLDVLPAVLSMLTHMLQSLQCGVFATSSSSGVRFQVTDTPAGTNPAERDYRHIAASLVAMLCKLLQDSLPPAPATAAVSALDIEVPPAAAAAAAAAAQVAGSVLQQPAAPPADTSGLGMLSLTELQARGQLGTILRRLEGFVRVTAAVPTWLTPLKINKPEGGNRPADAETTWAELTKLLDGRVCSFVQFVCSAGRGSAEVRQLQGLLVSLMKAAVACEAAAGHEMAMPAGAAALQLAATSGSNAAAGAAALILSSSYGGSCSSAASSAAAAAAGSAVSMLPSLVVGGRWCQQTAERMQAQPAASIAASFRATAAGLAQGLGQAWFGEDKPRGALVQVPEACLAFLERGGTSAQLAAAGYKPQQMQQAASGLLQALQGVEDGSVDGEVAVTAMIQQLQALGHALTAVAIRNACNNPSCGNVSELREQKVVSGSGRTCSNCRAARYCGKECSTHHWPQHKPVCNAVKKAARAVM